MAATATKKAKAQTKSTIQPIGDRIVVQRDELENTTSGGLVLPDSAKDKPARGVVLSVGTGRVLDDGTRAEMQVKEGDHILFSSYAPEELEIGGEEYLLMREDDVLAIIDI